MSLKLKVLPLEISKLMIVENTRVINLTLQLEFNKLSTF